MLLGSASAIPGTRVARSAIMTICVCEITWSVQVGRLEGVVR